MHKSIMDEYTAHLKSMLEDRKADAVICERARDHPEKLLNLSIDSMDVSKWKCPRNLSATKDFQGLWRPECTFTVILVEGISEEFFIMDMDVIKNSNLMITLLARAIHKALKHYDEKGWQRPASLRVHSDNAASETKNQLVFRWCAAMLHQNMFMEITGFLLTAVWASLRWGDLLWTPPARLHLQLSHGAILGTAVRTKTTNRSMPFGFLVVGLSGSPSVNWGVRFFNLLRQALADTLSLQPGRVVDFLPARLGGSDSRPLLLDPCERHLAVPRLLSLLAAHWSSNCTSQPPSQFALYGAHSCKATVLSWSRHMSLDRTLRRIQGHHRLSGADRSVELYGRDDIRPMLDLQAQVINHVRAGFRPLQPLARGSSVPLPDFAVQLPAALVPVLSGPSTSASGLPALPGTGTGTRPLAVPCRQPLFCQRLFR